MQLRSGKNFLDFLVATINLHYPVRLKVSCRGLLFDMSDNRRIPKKNETRRKKVVFRNDGGLEIARLSCNEIYHLTRFLE
ncbi:hypothetical protein [Desulfonema ishimotonii]|nr:hypothetical protein [Desulfonema ishimotonii]